MTGARRSARWAVRVLVAATLTTALAGGVSASQTAPPRIWWLAAGDSYSSGQGVAPSHADCGRAPLNAWAPLAKSALLKDKVLEVPDTSFWFVACSAATAGGAADGNTWAAQRAVVKGVGPYDLVTMTFGGNDIGFSKKIGDCIGLNHKVLLPPPIGIDLGWLHRLLTHRCSFNREQLFPEIADMRARLNDLYTSLVKDTSLLAPGGHVVVMGYPRLFADEATWTDTVSEGGYCWGIHLDDAAMWNEGIDQLNNLINEVTTAVDAHRIHFVDVNEREPSFEGHGLCGGDPWISPPTYRPDVFHSYHLTAAGEALYRDRAVATIRSLNLTAGTPTTTVAPQEPPTEPCPSGAECLAIMKADLDGDHRPDRIGLYLEQGRKVARAVLANGRASELEIRERDIPDLARPAPDPIGVVDADGDGREEAIIATGKGGNTFYPVGILKLDGTRLVLVGEEQPDGPPSFLVDTGLFHGAGFRCGPTGADGKPRLTATRIEHRYTEPDAGLWDWETRRYRWEGAALVLEKKETGTVQAVPETSGAEDPRTGAYYGIQCDMRPGTG